VPHWPIWTVTQEAGISFLLYRGGGVDERAPRCHQVLLSSLASAGVENCSSDALRSAQSCAGEFAKVLHPCIGFKNAKARGATR
jgi:hypothetical protein